MSKQTVTIKIQYVGTAYLVACLWRDGIKVGETRLLAKGNEALARTAAGWIADENGWQVAC